MPPRSRRFNTKYRAADAAACPHLALAAIVHAGFQGIEEGLTAPAPTEEGLPLLSPGGLETRGFIRLPTSLEAALAQSEGSAVASGRFRDGFAAVCRAHKQAEISHLDGMDAAARYAAFKAAG